MKSATAKRRDETDAYFGELADRNNRMKDAHVLRSADGVSEVWFTPDPVDGSVRYDYYPDVSCASSMTLFMRKAAARTAAKNHLSQGYGWVKK